jgi:membrane-associated phospholipid phosphatase
VNSSPTFALLLRRSLVAALVCALVVLVCYLFVDRPVASFVHRYKLADQVVLKWLTFVPPLLQAWSPAVIAALLVRRAFGSFRRWEIAALAACVSMILADQFRESLGYVFGRYWPETWIDNNPSFIKDGAYGFHPFHAGSAYGSFPSGHMARIVGLVSVVWVTYPGWRWACGLASLAIAAGLLGMNYHFVSDVIAGSFVGGIVGMVAASFAGLDCPSMDKV